MSKAVFIMDMPMCCYDCVFLEDSGDYPFCKATGETRGYTFRVRENKMDKCPLKDMPEKVDIENEIHSRDYEPDFDGGWNACIDEILGDRIKVQF